MVAGWQQALSVAVPALPAAWQCDLRDDRITWSRGVFDLFGLDPTIRPTRAMTLDLYEPESRALLQQLRSDAIDCGGSFTFEAAIRRPDGERRWMRLSADTVCRDGRAVLLYGTKQDITDEIAR